jgi:hypothetical protein
LIEVLPPSVRPCGYHIARLFSCFCGTVSKPQLTAGLVSLVKPTGMWIRGDQSRPPASSSRTLVAGFALSRLATTQPAAPAPTTM